MTFVRAHRILTTTVKDQRTILMTLMTLRNQRTIVRPR